MKKFLEALFPLYYSKNKNLHNKHFVAKTMELWIRTEITWKKVPCYMPDSACRWFIVKKAEIFWIYVKHFWILASVRKFWILIGLCKQAFLNLVSASFTFLLFRLLMPKIKFLIKCYCLNRYTLSIIKTKIKKLKKLNCYSALAKHC